MVIPEEMIRKRIDELDKMIHDYMENANLQVAQWIGAKNELTRLLTPPAPPDSPDIPQG